MSDFAIVALGNSDQQTMTEAALRKVDLTPLGVLEVERILFLLTDRPIRLLVLSLSLFRYRLEALRSLLRLCPESSVLLVADTPLQAQNAQVQFGGCIHHVFFYPPSPLEIREFALTALRKQASKKGEPFETETTKNG
jgi:hypothetical protein